MITTQFKLKQASAVLGVPPKELQNLVQFGVLRPRRRNDLFWFDRNLLLLAKIALYVKASLRPSVEYLAQLVKELTRVDLPAVDWEWLLLACSPGKGKTPVEIKVPLRDLKRELESGMALAETYRDLPRGRKRAGWKKEFLKTLSAMGDDMGRLSEQKILKTIEAYRHQAKKRPEISVVVPSEKSA